MEFRTAVDLSPFFLQGLLEEGMRMTRANPSIRVARHSSMSFDLHITW